LFRQLFDPDGDAFALFVWLEPFDEESIFSNDCFGDHLVSPAKDGCHGAE
jgi:hypothetical protein